MIISTEYVDIPADGTPMRMLVAAPRTEGRYPGILLIGQLETNGSMVR